MALTRSDKDAPKPNLDEKLVRDFGREWQDFDQDEAPPEELAALFRRYFSLFPWDELPENAKGFDLGCGSGRWAYFVAQKVAALHCIEPSDALAVARRRLKDLSNCFFHRAGVDDMPLADGSMDFGYTLGVLHHVPDTAAGIASCADKLKPGAPLLLYLYYAFDDRPLWFKLLWRVADTIRRGVSVLPYPLKYAISQGIAVAVYWPLARSARVLEGRGYQVESLPLSAYRDKSLYTMRTDALDRFGTRLEKRFNRDEIARMMTRAGLERISFREEPPFWCALGHRCRS